MKVSFDVVIKSGNDDVDMEYGIKTLGGTSEVTCLLAEAILRKRIIQRRTHVNPARAVLKQSFKSSYGQNFDVVVSEPALVSELNKMGRAVFSEVMSYFISESLYLETRQVSQKAATIINGLGDIEDEIIGRIRSPLKRMHEVNVKRGYDVELNYKKPLPAGKQRIAELNATTRVNLFQSRIANVQIQITAIITRFNSRTGNGRLVLQGENDTVPFGFYMPLKTIQRRQKTKISGNLHVNNGKNEEEFVYLTLTVSRVTILSGETIKYLIHTVD